MSGFEAQVQGVIEKKLIETQNAGLTMRLLNNAEAYMRSADAIHAWIDPACAQQRGGFEAHMFWLEVFDRQQRRAVVAAGTRVVTDDIMADIRYGHIWYPGGYAEHCALHHIDLADPNRLVAGQLSYLQIAVNKNAEPNQADLESLSFLIQALAIRHHKSDFSVHLGVHHTSVSGMPMLPQSFRFNEFLGTTYFPPAGENATLTLSHNSVDNFLRLAQAADTGGEEVEAEAVRVEA